MGLTTPTPLSGGSVIVVDDDDDDNDDDDDDDEDEDEGTTPRLAPINAARLIQSGIGVLHNLTQKVLLKTLQFFSIKLYVPGANSAVPINSIISLTLAMPYSKSPILIDSLKLPYCGSFGFDLDMPASEKEYSAAFFFPHLISTPV